MTFKSAVMLASSLVLAAAGGVIAQDVAREDTVIFDLDRTIKDPGNFNWFTPGTKRMHGAHQAMWEPLYILNYGTGDLDPWLATGYSQNDDSTEFTIVLRDGVAWSDGEAFDADDVVFTVNMVLNNEEITSREAATVRAQVAGVEAIDGLKVKFSLKASNPRFIVENFGVRIFGSFLIMPEHIWSGVDAATFANSEPVGTGPYTFTSAATTVGVVPVAVEDEEHVLEIRVVGQEILGVLYDTDRSRASVSGDCDTGRGEAQFPDQAAEVLGFGLAAFGNDHGAFSLFEVRGGPPRIAG